MSWVGPVAKNAAKYGAKYGPHAKVAWEVGGRQLQAAVRARLDEAALRRTATDKFKIAEALIKNLTCVNDCAERGVALMQTFNESITKNEEQKQFLLQVVEKHRKKFSKCNRHQLKDM